MFWTRVKQIKVCDAKSMIDQGQAMVIDIRRPKDYERSHIKGAILADKQHAHKTIESERKDSPIICYCYMGFSSRTTCKKLTKSGYTNVFNLKGGYTAWERGNDRHSS